MLHHKACLCFAAYMHAATQGKGSPVNLPTFAVFCEPLKHSVRAPKHQHGQRAPVACATALGQAQALGQADGLT